MPNDNFQIILVDPDDDVFEAPSEVSSYKIDNALMPHPEYKKLPDTLLADTIHPTRMSIGGETDLMGNQFQNLGAINMSHDKNMGPTAHESASASKRRTQSCSAIQGSSNAVADPQSPLANVCGDLIHIRQIVY